MFGILYFFVYKFLFSKIMRVYIYGSSLRGLNVLFVIKFKRFQSFSITIIFSFQKKKSLLFKMK